MEALGTEAFDLVKVTWRIPSTTATAERNDADEEEQEDADANPTAAALKAAAKRKRELPDDEPITHLELVVQYNDLQSDRLVDETRPTGFLSSSSTNQADEDEEAARATDAVPESTRKAYGTVRVQLLEYAPELETRQRRAPGISKADIKPYVPKPHAGRIWSKCTPKKPTVNHSIWMKRSIASPREYGGRCQREVVQLQMCVDPM